MSYTATVFQSIRQNKRVPYNKKAIHHPFPFQKVQAHEYINEVRGLVIHEQMSFSVM